MSESSRRKQLDPNFGKTKLTTADEVIAFLIEEQGQDAIVAVLSMLEMALSSNGIPGITALIPKNEGYFGLQFVEPAIAPDPKIRKFLSQCTFPQVRAFILWPRAGSECAWFAMELSEVEVLKKKLVLKLDDN